MDLASATGPLQTNSFIIFTFIVAPAILTNAAAMLILSTSNRFARAVDRARELSRQIEPARTGDNISLLERLNNELLVTEERAILLLNSMRSFYFSLGGFACAAVASLLGAGLVSIGVDVAERFLAPIAVITVFLGVGGLVIGSAILLYETRITVGILQERIRTIQNHQSEG